jgi:hypothetical protein
MAAVNAAERKELLRARAKVLPITGKVVGLGLARAAGKGAAWPKRVRYVVLPRPAGHGYASLGKLQIRALPKWIQAADLPALPVPKIKNNQGKGALTRIAERYSSPSYRAETKRLDLRYA